MKNIDRGIAEITGIQDYMSELAKVTGHINSIDVEFYTKQLANITKAHHLIIREADKFIETHAGNAFVALRDSLVAAWKNLDLAHAINREYRRKKTDTKTSVHVVIKPADIYRSQWFGIIKEAETAANKLCEEFDMFVYLSQEDFDKMHSTHYDSIEIYQFYGLKLNTIEACHLVSTFHRYLNKVIEIVLTPAYDCKAKIAKKWDGRFDKMFVKQIGADAPTEDIQKIVYNFVIAKYRLGLTGSTAQFEKIFLDIVPNDDIAELNSARYLNLIDSIDLSEFDKNDKIRMFAQSAKDAIHELMSGERVNAQAVIDKMSANFARKEPCAKSEDNEASMEDVL